MKWDITIDINEFLESSSSPKLNFEETKTLIGRTNRFLAESFKSIMKTSQIIDIVKQMDHIKASSTRQYFSNTRTIYSTQKKKKTILGNEHWWKNSEQNIWKTCKLSTAIYYRDYIPV